MDGIRTAQNRYWQTGGRRRSPSAARRQADAIRIRGCRPVDPPPLRRAEATAFAPEASAAIAGICEMLFHGVATYDARYAGCPR